MKQKHIELDPCPFCGGEARIQLCDEEGNWRNEEYLENPYTGIGYVIVHDSIMAKRNCPISTNPDDDMGLGEVVYDTEESAADAWNGRIG